MRRRRRAKRDVRRLRECAGTSLRYEAVGDKEALLASARYPKIEFTFTEAEQKLTVAEMEMLVEVGEIPRLAPLASLFTF